MMDDAFGVVGDDVPTWVAGAICTDRGALFFGPPRERPEARARREGAAIAICAACPVRVPCRQAGRDRREHGVWGGETEEERALAGFAPRSPSRRILHGIVARSA